MPHRGRWWRVDLPELPSGEDLREAWQAAGAALAAAAAVAEREALALVRLSTRVARKVEPLLLAGARRSVRLARRAKRVSRAAMRRGERELMAAQQATGLARETLLWACATLPILVFILLFSRAFPPLTAAFSGPALYTNAWFKYEPSVRFDSSIMTWGTDYIIAAVMGYLTYLIARVPTEPHGRVLQATSVLLIGSYSLSTLAGAFSHQFLPGRLNSAVFRFMWRLCVGCVAAGGGFMGGAATELANMPLEPPGTEATESDSSSSDDDDEVDSPVEGQLAASGADGPQDTAQDEAEDAIDAPTRNPALNFELPQVPQFFWVSYSLFFTLMNTIGFFSMKQPACDIFLVGVTQAPPTIYLTLALYARKSWAVYHVHRRARRILLFGELVNIALLPAYDVMNFLQMPLGVTNVCLHTTLLISWGAQGLGLLWFLKGIHRTASLGETPKPKSE